MASKFDRTRDLVHPKKGITDVDRLLIDPLPTCRRAFGKPVNYKLLLQTHPIREMIQCVFSMQVCCVSG